jgi:hypothetical protein
MMEKIVSGPRTARDLSRDLSPLLEEFVNLRYLLDHHPSYRATLKDHESDTLDRIVELVRDALVD